MKFSTVPMTASVEAFDAEQSAIELMSIKNDIMIAYEGLSDAEKAMNETSAILNNIKMATECLSKHGTNAISLVNADNALESLLDVAVAQITTEKAVEGLGEAASSAWKAFKNACNQFWEWIKKLCHNIYVWCNKSKLATEARIKNLEERLVKSEERAGKLADEISKVKIDTKAEDAYIEGKLSKLAERLDIDETQLRDLIRDSNKTVNILKSELANIRRGNAMSGAALNKLNKKLFEKSMYYRRENENMSILTFTAKGLAAIEVDAIGINLESCNKYRDVIEMLALDASNDIRKKQFDREMFVAEVHEAMRRCKISHLVHYNGDVNDIGTIKVTKILEQVVAGGIKAGDIIRATRFSDALGFKSLKDATAAAIKVSGKAKHIADLFDTAAKSLGGNAAMDPYGENGPDAQSMSDFKFIEKARATVGQLYTVVGQLARDLSIYANNLVTLINEMMNVNKVVLDLSDAVGSLYRASMVSTGYDK